MHGYIDKGTEKVKLSLTGDETQVVVLFQDKQANTLVLHV